MIGLLALVVLAPQTKLVRNVDADVVSVAMASFYAPSKWNFEWDKGKFVVIGSQHWPRPRAPFDELLVNLISWEKRDPKCGAKVDLLRKVRRSISNRAYKPAPALPLESLELDPRVVVSNEKVLRSLDLIAEQKKAEKEGRTFKAQEWTNRLGEKGDARVSGRLSSPSYSLDGRFALLHMGWVPWSSWHSAELTFLLKKGPSGWSVIHVGSVFFV